MHMCLTSTLIIRNLKRKLFNYTGMLFLITNIKLVYSYNTHSLHDCINTLEVNLLKIEVIYSFNNRWLISTKF